MIKFKKTTDVKIGANRFTLYHWPVTKVIRNMPRIARFFAVPVGTIVGAKASGSEGLQDALPTAILYLADQMDEDGALNLIHLLIGEDIEVNGFAQPIDIDDLFQDDPTELFELLKEVLRVNYGSFFTRSGFGSLQGLMEQFGLVKQVDQMAEETDQE
ncbi:hypothetical protein KASHIRA_00560 [Serratia phage vB_SmaM-Kashira]|nr:hypothetical protein KASHIRA_00560 [Serratia phage vB_SmaM-Kashira]